MHNVTDTATKTRPLPAEPWGSRLRRARLTAPKPYRVSHGKAAQFIGALTMVAPDATTIGRLEQLEEPPHDRKRRTVAYLLCRYYRIDPAELDLTDDDGPDETRRAEIDASLTKWYTTDPPHLKAA